MSPLFFSRGRTCLHQSCEFDEFDSLWAFSMTAGYMYVYTAAMVIVGGWSAGGAEAVRSNIDSSGKPQPTTSVHRDCLPMDHMACSHVCKCGQGAWVNCCSICINFELIGCLLGP